MDLLLVLKDSIRSFDFVMYGQDGGDLEMNLNGSSSRAEDDDFDDIVWLLYCNLQAVVSLLYMICNYASYAFFFCFSYLVSIR